VVPVMDLRKRFGLAAPTPDGRNRIVVADAGAHTVGMIVDAASEVLRLSVDMIEPPSTLVTSADSASLRGAARIDGP
jgi:purine-binding chemotaxis protein CheW